MVSLKKNAMVKYHNTWKTHTDKSRSIVKNNQVCSNQRPKMESKEAVEVASVDQVAVLTTAQDFFELNSMLRDLNQEILVENTAS